jgi:hypothetical protein
MGATMEQVQNGILDIGKLIVEGMQTWDKMSSKAPAASTGMISPETSIPATTNQSAAYAQTTASVWNNPAVLVGGAILLGLLLLRGRS